MPVEGSFSEVVSATDLVVLAEVKAIKGNAVDLVPEQILQGDFWLDSLRVWMQTWDYCRPPAESFLGDPLDHGALAIQKIPEGVLIPPPQSKLRSPWPTTPCRVAAVIGCGLMQHRDRNLMPGMPRLPSTGYVTRAGGSRCRLSEGVGSTEALVEASRERPEAVDELTEIPEAFRGHADWLPDEETNAPLMRCRIEAVI